MENFVKGIMVGLGAIAPGLSGSVLLVIFGLYQKTIAAISGLFRNFRANTKYLLPLAAGIGVGIVLFSRLVDWLLVAYEMQTRFAFLGLILGSVPLFFREVRKQGFRKAYWLLIAAAFAVGILLFQINRNLFPVVEKPSLWQSALLGLAVAASYIVPGVDSAAILSALGLYNLWVHSLATLDFSVLFPAILGAAVGVLVVSALMARLIRSAYTVTFSVIFGLFLSIIPSVLDESCEIGKNWQSAVSVLIFLVSFLVSVLFSNLDKLRSKKKSPKEGTEA